MTDFRVITPKRLPARLPILSTAVGWPLLDRFSPPLWLWGAAGALSLIWWGLVLYALIAQELVDLFEGKHGE